MLKTVVLMFSVDTDAMTGQQPDQMALVVTGTTMAVHRVQTDSEATDTAMAQPLIQTVWGGIEIAMAPLVAQMGSGVSVAIK